MTGDISNEQGEALTEVLHTIIAIRNDLGINGDYEHLNDAIAALNRVSFIRDVRRQALDELVALSEELNLYDAD